MAAGPARLGRGRGRGRGGRGRAVAGPAGRARPCGSASPIGCGADAAEVVAELQRRGYAVALLSGDREPTVRQVAAELGIDDWQAGCTPADKTARLEGWASRGPPGADGGRRPQRCAGAGRGLCLAVAVERGRHRADRRRRGVPGRAPGAGAGGDRRRPPRRAAGQAELRAVASATTCWRCRSRSWAT